MSLKIDTDHVNENSFQKFAKFFDVTVPKENGFDEKLNSIYILIKEENMTDINKIAEKADCSVAECVLKIRYLKNKKLIDELYIDTPNMMLIPCSYEDQKLLDKFKPFIYGSHSQIAEFAHLIPNPNNIPLPQYKHKLLEELRYLNNKGLLNGIKIDDIDGEIIYYALEKKKTFKNMETTHCLNCGALNDVEITGKVRCSYCNSIVVGSKYNELDN